MSRISGDSRNWGQTPFFQLQVSGDQLLPLAAMFTDCGARLLVDQYGRPDLDPGLDSTGFRAVLALADTGRAWI